jgi:hypothetical protein
MMREGNTFVQVAPSGERRAYGILEVRRINE